MGNSPPDQVLAKVRGLAEPLGQWTEDLGLGDAEVFYRIGLWYALEGRNEEAAVAFQKAVQRGMSAEAWLALGDVQWSLYRRKKARDAYRPCKDEKRTPAHIFYRCAQVAYDERRYAEALADLEHILGRRKPDVEVFALASLVCGKLGDHEKAVAVLESGLKKHADNPLLMANMVIPLAELEQMERAQEVYEKAREIDPDLAEAPFVMAVVHMRDEDLDGAVELLEEALVLREEYPEALFCMGVIHNRRNEFQKALGYFKKAVELKPDYAEAYYNMKDAYDGLRDYENSIAVLEKAVQLNPEYR